MTGKARIGSGLLGALVLACGLLAGAPVRGEAATLFTGVKQVDAGAYHTCAVKTDGTVWCWGDNGGGALGDGTTIDRTRPVQVRNLTGVTQVSVGNYQACARRSNGTVWCWGGTLDWDYGLTPVRVPTLTGVVRVVSGSWFGCAVRSNGTVWCWGSRYDGVIGDGGSTSGEEAAWPPVQVMNVTGAVEVSAGLQSACARTSNGTVWCWGRNAVGQVGDPDAFIARAPVQVQGLPGPVTQLQVGDQHACARRADGSVWCWGWNHDGQLGDGTTTNRDVATRSLMTKAVSVSPGRDHTCARTSANRVKCWGENGYGQLGNGTTVERWTPVAVVGLTGVTAVSAGYGHSCALLTDRTLRCWGNNDEGQLGNGTTTSSAFPAPVLS